MSISKEILNVVDGLAKRFGVVVDWSKDNIYPQIADLCERFIHYKLACEWIWFAVFAAILVVGIVLITMQVRDRRDFVEKVKSSGALGLKQEKIRSRRNLYYCNYYFVLHKETGGYSVDEINATLLGELSVVGACSCFTIGIIGVICSLATLIKLYIIPEVVIINYITGCIGGH